ncbi:MAG TPA: hypothetical protein RMG48_08300 [Myxococcales bacterium LLY-WYZ-16_1]|nr:hypothetical protein [Myxococcales bacterium LLY-WYZ-16_1]
MNLFMQFGFSRGSYRNAVRLVNPTSSDQCTLASPVEPSCLFYTKQCDICPPDPDAQPGEVSCGCLSDDALWSRPQPLSILVAPGGTTALNVQLRTDYTGDGIFDQTLHTLDADNLPRGQRQVRIYDLEGRFIRFDWEDIPQGPDGDYNDFMHFLSGRQCSREQTGQNEGFPDSAVRADQIMYEGVGGAGNIPDDCDTSCQRGDPVLRGCGGPGQFTAGAMRHLISIGVDRKTTEYTRESHGRMLHLSVFTGVTERQGQTVAVCPSLLFEDPTPGVNDTFVGIEKGNAQGPASGGICTSFCTNPAQPTDACCASARPGLWRLAFSRQMDVSAPACPPAARSAEDQFVLQAEDTNTSASCDFNMFHVEHYEVALSELSVHYGVNLNSETAQDILDRIGGVNLDVIGGLDPNQPFTCPSGWNVELLGVNTNIGQMVKRLVLDDLAAEEIYSEYIRL